MFMHVKENWLKQENIQNKSTLFILKLKKSLRALKELLLLSVNTNLLTMREPEFSIISMLILQLKVKQLSETIS